MRYSILKHVILLFGNFVSIIVKCQLFTVEKIKGKKVIIWFKTMSTGEKKQRKEYLSQMQLQIAGQIQ